MLNKNYFSEEQNTMSSTISWLRFPLIFGVVFIHCSRYWRTLEIDWENFDGMQFYYFLHNLLSELLLVVCVPTFFFISGYLFFFKQEKLDKPTYINKMRRRVRTLLVPYILWILVAILLLFSYAIRSNGFSFSEISDFNWIDAFIGMIPNHKADDTSILGLALRQNKMFPADGPLWYVRDLMLWNMLAPIFYCLIKKTKYIFLSFMTIIWLLQIWPYTRLNLFGLYCFILSFYFGINKLTPIIDRGAGQFSLYVVCLLLIIVISFQVVENKAVNYFLLCVFQLLGIFAVFNIGCRAMNTKCCHYPAFFMEGSFFIFAFHQIRTVSDTERLLDILFCHSQNWIVLTTEYILTPVIVVAICLLVYKVLRRICPKVLYVLDGR